VGICVADTLEALIDASVGISTELVAELTLVDEVGDAVIEEKLIVTSIVGFEESCTLVEAAADGSSTDGPVTVGGRIRLVLLSVNSAIDVEEDIAEDFASVSTLAVCAALLGVLALVLERSEVVLDEELWTVVLSEDVEE